MTKVLKDITVPDPEKLRLRQDPVSKLYTLYAVSEVKIALCRYVSNRDPNTVEHEDKFRKSQIRIPAVIDDFRIFLLDNARVPAGPLAAVCKDNEVIVTNSMSSNKPTILYRRSPQAIIEYLGAMLRLQERRE